MSVIHRALTIALNFLRQHTPESSARLCAVMLCVTGCWTAIKTVQFAFLHIEKTEMVVSLVGVTSALIASGCVAILARTKDCDFKDGAP